MTEYINKEEILKSLIRTHHYDRERGNAHYIRGVESAWVNEDDFYGYGEK